MIELTAATPSWMRQDKHSPNEVTGVLENSQEVLAKEAACLSLNP